MIIGFSRYSTGRGRDPVDYVSRMDRPGREESPPVVLRGSPEATTSLIDLLDFKHRYTSGVLSFAPGETVTPAQERAIMDRFESVAFAELAPDQYNVLWVRHSHAGHHELHFVTPRVELSTGKSLNIRPPGDGTKRVFDDLRSEINARYGFADPDDPARARNVAVPDFALKQAAESLRKGETPEIDVRVALDAVLSQRAIQGVIRSRSDLTEQIRELGFEVPREGKNYITVLEPESGSRWRMKGALYEREFDVDRAIEAAAANRARDYSSPCPAAARDFSQRVERHIRQRAEYNLGCYQSQPQGDDKRDHRTGLHVEQGDHQRPDNSTAEPDYRSEQNAVVTVAPPCTNPAGNLGSYLSQSLGSDAVLHQADRRVESQHDATGGQQSRAGEEPGRSDTAGIRGAVLDLRRSGLRGDQPGQQNVQLNQRRATRIQDSGEQLNDRAGATLIDRLEAFGTRIRSAGERLLEGARGIVGDVRKYQRGQQAAPGAGEALERAGQHLECAVREEQEIARARDRLRHVPRPPM